MRDFGKPLIGVGPLAPDDPLQWLRAKLSGSNLAKMPADVNARQAAYRERELTLAEPAAADSSQNPSQNSSQKL
jgi:hypothetical protein